LTYMELLEEKKILNTYCGTAATATNIGNKYTFRVTNPAAVQNITTIEILSQMGWKSLGILNTNNEYGHLGLADFEKWAEKEGATIVCEWFNINDPDLSAQVARLMDAKCDGYMVYAQNGTDQINGFRTFRRAGYTGYLWGTESNSSLEFRTTSGKDANGAIYAATTVVPDTPEDAVNEQEKAFLEAFMSEYGEYPISDVSYRMYDGVTLIAHALNKCKDLIDRDAWSEAFFSIKGFKGVQGEFDYTSRTGDGIAKANVFVIHEGKNVVLDKWLQSHKLSEPYPWKK